jgi:hypothetical protein
MPSLAVVVPLGPSAPDLHGLGELLEAFGEFAPWAGPFVIVNDRADPSAVQGLLDQHQLKGVVLPNPRAGKGSPLLGRLNTGLFHAYAFLAQHSPGYHVLKIDTDALLIRPLQAPLEALLASAPDGGYFATTAHEYLSAEEKDVTALRHAAGASGDWNCIPRDFKRLADYLSRRETFPWFSQQILGSRAVARRLIRRAYANGYRFETAINSGVALLSAEAIRRFAQLPELRHRGFLASDAWFGEDHLSLIATHAVGLRIVPQNQPGDLLHSRWRGLPGTDLADLDARGHALIHSLKSRPPFNEAETRAYFRARRLRLDVSS